MKKYIGIISGAILLALLVAAVLLLGLVGDEPKPVEVAIDAPAAPAEKPPVKDAQP